MADITTSVKVKNYKCFGGTGAQNDRSTWSVYLLTDAAGIS
jgi:hypothetical protein